MSDNPIPVKVRPMERIKQVPEIVYERVEPYIPKTSGEGKGVMYATIGLGVAAAIGLVGYGVYRAIPSASQCTSSTPCGKQMSVCDKELTSIGNQITTLTDQFIAEDVANNVAYPTTEQQKTLSGLYQQQNTIIQTCVASVSSTYHLDFISAGISDLFYAGALAITLIAGAKAYSYIKNRGYFKPPKKGNGGFSAPATFWSAFQMGYIDYLKSIGKIPATWDSNGSDSVNTITTQTNSEVQTYVSEMTSLDLITSAEAALITASAIEIVAENSVLVLAVLA